MFHHHHVAGLIALCLLLPTGRAWAGDLCAERPGLGTPPCTVERGRVVLETGLADWTRDTGPETRTDAIEAGQALLRFGVADRLEAQLGWTAYGWEKERDRLTGAVDRRHGSGDVTLALRRNLRNPDGEGLSFAIMPRITLPVGGEAIGDGTWSTGLLAPAAVAIGSSAKLVLTPEIDAAADADRAGRHLAYGGSAGVELEFGKTVATALESYVLRDDDPEGHETQALAGLSVEWQPSDDLQFDLGMNIGLNHDSPDRQLYVGVTRRL